MDLLYQGVLSDGMDLGVPVALPAQPIDGFRRAPRDINPGAEHDRLFDAKHHQIDDREPCNLCERRSESIIRYHLQGATALSQVIHFGPITCGDSVIKLGEDRDAIAAAEGVLAFEMESAGVWDVFPCVVYILLLIVGRLGWPYPKRIMKSILLLI